MRRWKKTTLLCLGMGLCFSAGVAADNGLEQIKAYLRKDFTIKVNGEKLDLANPPIVYNNVTYLPLTELGKSLNADTVWDGSTKTVYVNPRLYTSQPSTDTSELEEIKLNYLRTQTATYLGRKYPILINAGTNNSRFYREIDLQRMGVDTSGLKKVVEKYTKELYVEESEAKKAWKETPHLEYTYTFDKAMVVGEDDEKKVEALSKFKPGIPLLPADYYSEEDLANPIWEQQYNGSVVYVIDPVPGKANQYRALYYYDQYYFHYYITLASDTRYVSTDGKSNKETYWYVKEYSSEFLGPTQAELQSMYPGYYMP